MKALADTPASRWLARVDQRRWAVLFALTFALAWSLVEVLVTRLHQAYSLVQVEGVRFGVQLLLMSMMLLWSGRRSGPAEGRRLWHTRRPLQLLRALAMLALPFAFAAAVYSGVSLRLTLSGLWFAPLFALGLATLFLRERGSLLLWAMALAGPGAVLLLAPGRPGSPLALLLPLASGLALALIGLVLLIAWHGDTARRTAHSTYQ